MLNISNFDLFPWAECNFRENRKAYISDSISLKRTKRSTGIFRYEFELITVEMEERVGLAVMAKLSRAWNDTLTFIHPRWSYTSGTVPAGALLRVGVGGASAGVDTVPMLGDVAWELKTGDFIQPANDTKVYQVAEDTGLGTTANVKLTTSIRNDFVANDAITYDDVAWHLESDGVIEVATEAVENQDIIIVLNAVEKLS